MHTATVFDEADRAQTGTLGDLDFRFAFQSIMDVRVRRSLANEALLRGVAGEPASTILARIAPHNRVWFDQVCRSRAIELAHLRGLGGRLHLNCTEGGFDDLPRMLSETLNVAGRCGLTPDRIVLEFRDLERFGSARQLSEARQQCRAAGFGVAADNIGIGEIGLKRLAVFCPDMVKFDRQIVAGIHLSRVRQAMVTGLVAACRSLQVEMVATGVEQSAEYEWLAEAGIHCFQGYLISRPDLMIEHQALADGLES